jgi:rubredoxin
VRRGLNRSGFILNCKTWRVKKRVYKCEFCDFIFHPIRPESRFCSLRCYDASRIGSPEVKAHLDRIRLRRPNSLNHMWKGNLVGKAALHVWVRRRLKKPELCVCCNKIPPLDLANKSQKYKRSIKDFEWLCRKCHMKKDGRLDILTKGYERRQRELVPKQCEFCEKLFISKEPPCRNIRFCSKSCACKFHHKTGVYKKCR